MLLRMRTTYCACVLATHLTTIIRANLFRVLAAAVQLAIFILASLAAVKRVPNHPKVMTDDSAPPSTPPPPRSPGGSQGPEAPMIDLPRALSVAENLLLAIRGAQSESGVSRTPGKLGSITLVSVWGAATLNATPPLRIGV